MPSRMLSYVQGWNRLPHNNYLSVFAGGAGYGESDQEDSRHLQSHVWSDLQTTWHHRVGIKPNMTSYRWDTHNAQTHSTDCWSIPPFLSLPLSLQHSHGRRHYCWLINNILLRNIKMGKVSPTRDCFLPFLSEVIVSQFSLYPLYLSCLFVLGY